MGLKPTYPANSAGPIRTRSQVDVEGLASGSSIMLGCKSNVSSSLLSRSAEISAVASLLRVRSSLRGSILFRCSEDIIVFRERIATEYAVTELRIDSSRETQAA